MRAGAAEGLACFRSAAMAAACGAAALVPKKLGKASPSLSWNPKKEVLTPSTATICGFFRVIGLARRVPLVEKRIGVFPEEEYFSSTPGATPYSGVSNQAAAPTAMAPAAFSWP